MEETTGHCHTAHCEWIHLSNLTGLHDVPPLRPDPELSGIGVVLGFSLTAYLTLVLLILHYVTVYDFRRARNQDHAYVNCVDRGLLTFFRERIFNWKPSRRFEYAMEKAVLILSDTQLVTGLAILVSGYSQLDCGISAYHWQVMVYVAWFSSFSFLSAMAFLEGYFQTNTSLRIIRVVVMFILASLMIVALIPTGSQNWLNLLPRKGGFYPSLNAICYFQQLGVLNFNSHRGPKLWSMVISILVVGISYIHSAIRLFDPTAGVTRRYFRGYPGSIVKRLLRFLEARSNTGIVHAIGWTPIYLLTYAAFVSARALYDIAESMLMEIIWLCFAVAWGSIKLYDTRKSVGYSSEGEWIDANQDIIEENTWSFGQILPLVLLLLPILCMAQAYLDNDAKAADAAHRAALKEQNEMERSHSAPVLAGVTSVHVEDQIEPIEAPDPRSSTSCSITRCNHHPSLAISRTHTGCSCSSPSSPSYIRTKTFPAPPTPSLQTATATSQSPLYRSRTPHSTILPGHPYAPFSGCDWYHDHILLYVLQVLIVVCFALFLLGYQATSNFLGLSMFLRNKLFLGWILGAIPAAALFHLLVWYVGALIVRAVGLRGWLVGESKNGDDGRRGDEERGQGEKAGRKRMNWGSAVYFALRMVLVGGTVAATFCLSFEVAGPDALTFY